MKKQETHIVSIEKEIDWLTQVIDTRLKLYFNNECAFKGIEEIPVPDFSAVNDLYANFVREHALNHHERLALILSLVPYYKPQLLDVFYTKNASYDRGFTEFGGIKGKNFGGFLPTGETLLFVLTGIEVGERLKVEHFFLSGSVLLKKGVLKIISAEKGEPVMSGALTISPEYYSYFSTGEQGRPDYSTDFPAQLIQTPMEWEDLILDYYVMQDIEEIRSWIEWHHEWKQDKHISKKIKPGYRALFYGPPGTGKTLTASLLGKITGREVYKIDLSMVVSKYIGETEKNLAGIFDMAQNKNWILFFDEADALFGKRTNTVSSNDRYANQEVSYLLQRIENFPGVIILASNLRSNIDEAFARRFQAMIHFPMPNIQERVQLWKSAFAGNISLAPDVDFNVIGEKYILSGGSIINILLYCLIAARRKNKPISMHDISDGIKRELRKEGKTM